MNRSYFCDRCCKGYNTEDSAHHNCKAQNWPAVNKVRLRAMMDVQILPYGQNQTEFVKNADVNFMVRRVLQTISYI